MAEIKGPSGQVKTNIETPMPHRTRVCFTPLEVGEYSTKFTWNRVPLPNSPLVGVTSIALPPEERSHVSSNKSRASSISSSGSGGDHKVILTGNGLAKAMVDAEAEFTIDGSRAGPGTSHIAMFNLPSLFHFQKFPYFLFERNSGGDDDWHQIGFERNANFNR